MDCQTAPELRKDLGCEEPTQMPVWEIEDYEFYSCPLSFVSPAVWEWYSEYLYMKEFGVAPTMDRQSALFIEAWSTYTYWYGKLCRQKMDKDRERHSSPDGLQTLKEGFLARSK